MLDSGAVSRRLPSVPYFDLIRVNLKRLGLVLLACLTASLPLPAKSKPSTSSALDHDYISALAAANQFLHAWRTQDHEAGLILLSDAARQRTSEDRLQGFFSPASGTVQAFEIRHGKKLKPGRYSFPVVLLEITPLHAVHQRFSHIIVTRASKEDWAVDKLP
ncbi:MAG TPA: hypothetical protein VMT28_05030 [Terriglobales bacterium]|jgi:hypothetical protein|nr:hypothetical protein [Terriglobales bacterium]